MCQLSLAAPAARLAAFTASRDSVYATTTRFGIGTCEMYCIVSGGKGVGNLTGRLAGGGC